MINNLYVISALLGNWWGESHINPGIWEGLKIGAPGYGLGQWTDNSKTKRRTALMNWLHANGYAMDSAEGQIKYFLKENVWYSVRHARNFNHLSDFLHSNSKDIEYLTYAFLEGWEGIWDGSQQNRLNHARAIYDYLENHADDSVSGWITGNRYLTDAEVLHNAVLAARILMEKTDMTFNAEYSLQKTSAVAAYGKANGWKYGDSKSQIPCADGIASCDRLLARSDWDANDQLHLNMPAQETGGYKTHTMEAYYNSTGLFTKITDPAALKRGDRVLMGTVGEKTASASWHAFQIVNFRSVNDIDKYDYGSIDRIKAGGYFAHVPLNEWQGKKYFYAAWRLKTDYKEDTDTTHYISNCGHDEHGTYSGGQAGDQTGTEWQLRSWYSRSWDTVFRHPNAEIGKLIADLSVEAANNNLIGYDQGQRETFWDHLAASHYHPSQITIACETDCSAGVAAIVKAAGYLTSTKSMQSVDVDMNTGSERTSLTAAGFTLLTDSKYVTSADYLMPGDILLCSGHHTAINVTKGGKAVPLPAPTPVPVPSTSNKTVTLAFSVPIKLGDKGIDVLAVQELLRSRGYKGTDGKTVIKIDRDYGTNTECAVKKFQKDNKLTVTGIIDEATMLRMFGKG